MVLHPLYQFRMNSHSTSKKSPCFVLHWNVFSPLCPKKKKTKQNPKKHKKKNKQLDPSLKGLGNDSGN